MTRLLTCAVALLTLGACASGPAGVPNRMLLRVSMTGIQEVPGPGDADGNGTAEIRITANDGQVCWDVYVRAIGAVTVAHIHRGQAGSAGPPVVTLTTPDASGRSRGCATVDPAVARDIALRGYEYYLNIHTADHPGGAIRGQLRAAEPMWGPRPGRAG